MLFVLSIIILGIVCTILILVVISFILPKQRVVTKQSVYEVSPRTLYNIVTNNGNWTYRSDLSNLEIIEKQGETEVWEETDHKGNIIRFRTREKIPYSFYSFDMYSKIFTGYWTAHFEELPEGKSLFTATEYISVKNPLIKTLSYLFFDIGKFMQAYQEDLNKRVTNTINTDDKKGNPTR